MDKSFDSQSLEIKWYEAWEKHKVFHANTNTSRKSYCIVIPPPNVTGSLTLGHVLNNTLQDILIRWRKMQGFVACWVPGTDHAGIATQCQVEKHLKKTENLTRHELGREAFIERVWEWKNQFGRRIVTQLKRLGVSCDWDRERFTLDAGLSRAVSEVFVRLYNRGLIYRGERMINWCPASRTALSDEEVIYREMKSNLWYIKYPFVDGTGGIVVATTRPETLFGDTAVAVNPDDERYKDVIGKYVNLPLTERTIPIITDSAVDSQMGTGAVKITPAHDFNDYEIGLRHKLPVINVMNEDATMNKNAGVEFVGLERYECRKKALKLLTEAGLLVKEEEWIHQIGYSERGDVPVEPRISEQWFVRMKPLAEPALQAVLTRRIKFHPERWVKTYQHWMTNIKDWCISRQIWWGHRIPAYYCKQCKNIVVSVETPQTCPACNSNEMYQDEDVLDTWFSSWLWPFSVFGWPEQTNDLKVFYPTDTLVTGPDIIFFWVARMIMAGLEFMGDIPFRDVYFTPIIRDEKGRKLSKSLGNSPDPIDVMDTYGADAIRFTMVYLVPVGQDIRYSNKKCETGRNFATKLWNASRFLKLQGADKHILAGNEKVDSTSLLTSTPSFVKNLTPEEKYIVIQLQKVIASTTDSLEAFRFNEASHILYDFVWHQFCDWYIEYVKYVSKHGEYNIRQSTIVVANYVLCSILKLLHPIMPYLTEEIWHIMGYGDENDFLVLQQWPTHLSNSQLTAIGLDEHITQFVEAKHELIRIGRLLKAELKIPASFKSRYIIKPLSEEFGRFLHNEISSMITFLNASSITIQYDFVPNDKLPCMVTALATIFMSLDEVADASVISERLASELEASNNEINRIQTKLADEQFLQKAPSEIIDRHKLRLIELQNRTELLNDILKNMSSS